MSFSPCPVFLLPFSKKHTTPFSWYRSGSEQKLQSVLKPGGGRDVATTSVLTINPGKDDDGAEYRCVVWNRALTDSEKMEASVTLSVNCKAPLGTLGLTLGRLWECVVTDWV